MEAAPSRGRDIWHRASDVGHGLYVRSGTGSSRGGRESLWTTDVAVDTLWILVAGILVFFTNTGFGCVEAGFCRAKNAVNILAKNFVVFGIASIAFWVIG